MVRWLQRGKLNIGQPKPTNAHYVTRCCLVTKSCLTLRNPMDYSTVDFSAPHHPPEFAQVHVYESVMPSNHFILYCPLLFLPSIFSSISVFSNESAFASRGQSIRASASGSVLPKSIQGWFSLRLTDLISLLSKGLSRVFSSTTVLLVICI